jgi:hypothetical protein
MEDVSKEINVAVTCKGSGRGRAEVRRLRRNHSVVQVGGNQDLPWRDEVDTQKCWGLVPSEIRG